MSMQRDEDEVTESGQQARGHEDAGLRARDLREFAASMSRPPGDRDERATISTDSDETWKSAADLGFSRYEVSADSFGRDQQPVRRAGTGKLLALSLTGQCRYPQVKLYNDEGKQQTVTVHSLVLGVYAGPRPDGMQARHLDDDPWNNRWRPGGEAETRVAGGNLIWGTRPENEEDRYRNGRPRPTPRPVRHCVLCSAVLTSNAKRCHDCVVRLGVAAAPLLRAGQDPADVAAALDYPSIEGIVKLAIVHGGYGQSRLRRWLHTVAARLRITDGD